MPNSLQHFRKEVDVKKLWTRDFTILTFGSIVSIFGNKLSGFAINLMVLDFSDSVFLFILYMVIFNLPKILVPLVAGPYLDNFSRRKAIYSLDFLSSVLFIALYFIVKSNIFNYVFFLIISLVFGTIDSIYEVAYESLYPVLVSEGNFRKAYSVSSMIMPLSNVMIPVSTYLYEKAGVEGIFICSALTFLIAACFETQIRADESYIRKNDNKYSFEEFKSNFREGFDYIKGEKGLLVITGYFFVSMFCGSSGGLILPYFKNTESLGVMLYSYVMGASVIGRFIGGAIQYKLDYPASKKFTIAITVYTTLCIIKGLQLYAPLVVMTIISFLVGIMGVTSYNIRISTTQSYIPDSKRARYNGAFQMLMNVGMIAGQLSAGAIADFMPIRSVILLFNGICFAAVFGIMWRGRESVKLIYNRSV